MATYNPVGIHDTKHTSHTTSLTFTSTGNNQAACNTCYTPILTTTNQLLSQSAPHLLIWRLHRQPMQAAYITPHLDICYTNCSIVENSVSPSTHNLVRPTCCVRPTPSTRKPLKSTPITHSSHREDRYQHHLLVAPHCFPHTL